MPQYAVALAHEGLQHPNPNTIHFIFSELDIETLKQKDFTELFPDDPPTCCYCRTNLTIIVGVEPVKLMERRQRQPRWRVSMD